MISSGISGPVGQQTSSRSENAASGPAGAIWHAITGVFRYVCGTTTDDVELPVNKGNSIAPLKDLNDREIKDTSLSPLLLPNADGHARSFNEVVRRIKQDRQSQIITKVNTTTTRQLEQIIHCCCNPDQITTEHRNLLHSDDFAYAALRAFREKKISRNEFATLVTLHGIYQEGTRDNSSFKICHHRLFDNRGKANKDAWDFLASSLQSSNTPDSFPAFDVRGIIHRMTRLLKDKPPVEAGFWIYDWPDLPKEYDGQRTIRRVLADDVGIKFLFGGQGSMMCAPITLRQAFLESFCREETHEINPVIGISTVEDIRTGSLKRHRDMAIPFPGHPLPKTADHLPAPTIAGFQFHDWYHALRASMLKNSDIDIIIPIGDAINTLKKDVHKEYLDLQKTWQERKENFEKYLSGLSPEKQQQAKENSLEHTNILKMGKKLSTLKHTRIALGQLAFYLHDMETFEPVSNISPYHRDEDLFKFHLSNILFQMNRHSQKPWRKTLSNTDAAIAGQKIIPMIAGNLTFPKLHYKFFCKIIDWQVENLFPEGLTDKQKQEIKDRSKVFIKPLKTIKNSGW